MGIVTLWQLAAYIWVEPYGDRTRCSIRKKEVCNHKEMEMNWKTFTCLTAGVVGLTVMADATAEPAPRKGLGHGECERITCNEQGREQIRERKYKNRDADGNRSETRERQRRGEGFGKGSGQGEFRHGSGQGQGWHRDRTGDRKAE